MSIAFCLRVCAQALRCSSGGKANPRGTLRCVASRAWVSCCLAPRTQQKGRLGDAPRDAPDEADKLVEVLCARPRQDRAPDDGERPEAVLLPLDLEAALAALRGRKEAVLHDAHGGEELQWGRQEDRDRVEELGRRDELVVLRQVDEDDRLVGGRGPA